jgi:hypothetical protein
MRGKKRLEARFPTLKAPEDGDSDTRIACIQIYNYWLQGKDELSAIG